MSPRGFRCDLMLLSIATMRCHLSPRQSGRSALSRRDSNSIKFIRAFVDPDFSANGRRGVPATNEADHEWKRIDSYVSCPVKMLLTESEN